MMSTECLTEPDICQAFDNNVVSIIVIKLLTLECLVALKTTKEVYKGSSSNYVSHRIVNCLEGKGFLATFQSNPLILPATKPWLRDLP